MKKPLLLLASGIATLVVAGVALAATVVVHPGNMDGWAEDSTPLADVAFVNGPGTPPLGTGSAQFSVDASGATDAELRNGLYDGLSLAGITQLEYSTYVQNNNGGQAVYIILNVDRDNNGTIDDLLFFEPVYQNGAYATLLYSAPVPNQCGANPACVTLNTWQTWDADIGGWWSLVDSAGGPPLTTLSSYAAQYPGSVIRNAIGPTKGGVRLVAGFGGPADWGNFLGNTDAFTINGTTYDFELTPPIVTPPSKDACKEGGWQNFQRADGSTFKNQGDCIEYVNTGK